MEKVTWYPPFREMNKTLKDPHFSRVMYKAGLRSDDAGFHATAERKSHFCFSAILEGSATDFYEQNSMALKFLSKNFK